jgi:hypothetical protein
MSKTPILAVAVSGALLVNIAVSGAVPLPGETGGFGITPARRHVVGHPAVALTPTTVINGTNFTYDVKVFPVLLTQTLSGAFAFSETPRNLNDSKIVLTASPASFDLSPGARRSVRLTWNLLPAGSKWVAIGVVFQGVARDQTGPVHVVSRLLSVNFLRLPGLTLIRGRFTGLYPEQSGPHALRFLARVKNTGDRFWAPSDGRFVIRDSAGRVRLSEGWTGDVVIPGAERDFPIDVTKILPAGSYTATVSMRFGANRSRSTRFTLVGPNELPTPAIAIQGFNATGTVGSPAHLTAQLRSTGTSPAAVTLRTYLGASGAVAGSPALATGQVTYRDLAPGSTTQINQALGGPLRKGSYRAILSWSDPTGAPHQLEADFTAAVSRSFLQRLWGFIKHHAVLLIGVLALALLLALAYVLDRMRRQQRQAEADLAAAREQMKGPVTGDERVNVENADPQAEPPRTHLR